MAAGGEEHWAHLDLDDLLELPALPEVSNLAASAAAAPVFSSETALLS
jgi:hypothetical protein